MMFPITGVCFFMALKNRYLYAGSRIIRRWRHIGEELRAYSAKTASLKRELLVTGWKKSGLRNHGLLLKNYHHAVTCFSGCRQNKLFCAYVRIAHMEALKIEDKGDDRDPFSAHLMQRMRLCMDFAFNSALRIEKAIFSGDNLLWIVNVKKRYYAEA